jgi:GxxExxY protein
VVPNQINEITSTILRCAFTVHTALGPGLLESSYEECLSHEMNEADLLVTRQLGLPLIYKPVKLDIGYRVDFMVEQKVIVEFKHVKPSMMFTLHKCLHILNCPPAQLDC